MAKETPLQTFIRRVRIANQASEAVDYFDLSSSNPASKAEFKALQEKSKKAFKKLHKFCRSHKFKEIKAKHNSW